MDSSSSVPRILVIAAGPCEEPFIRSLFGRRPLYRAFIFDFKNAFWIIFRREGTIPNPLNTARADEEEADSPPIFICDIPVPTRREKDEDDQKKPASLDDNDRRAKKTTETTMNSKSEAGESRDWFLPACVCFAPPQAHPRG